MSDPSTLLGRLRLAMSQTAISPHNIIRTAEKQAWCVSFGHPNSFYADADLGDNGLVWGSHFGPFLRLRSYSLEASTVNLRRWLIFAHAWCGDNHTTGQKLLMASRMSHNEACGQTQ